MSDQDIQTIEQALAHMGRRMGGPDITQRARKAAADGDALELVVRVSPSKKAGVVVTMHSTLTSVKESHGRLIRLA